jgi:hypothetical protein
MWPIDPLSYMYMYAAKNDLDRKFRKTYLENYIINHLEILHAC